MPILHEVLPAAVAGCASTIVGHPLDCVKVHMQTAATRQSAWGCAAGMLRSSGPAAFARGLGAPLMNAVLMNTVMFVGFAEARKLLPDGTASALLAGFGAGLLQACVGTPLDYVKIQAQVRGGVSSAGLFAQCVRLYPGRLWTGHSMNVMREGVFTMLYLGLYSRVRDGLVVRTGDEMPLRYAVLAAASTGGLAWLACYPFDTVKSVQQAVPVEKVPSSGLATVGGAARAVHAKGGRAAFFRGAGASVLRACLVTSSRMLAYEAVKPVVESRF